MDPNEHVCLICYRPEVAGDASPGQNVRIIDVLLNFDVDEILENHFMTAAEAKADIGDSIIRKGFRVSLKMR